MWQNVSNDDVKSNRAAWLITLSLASPVFSVSSHISFILVAWLTDARKASSVALIGLAILLYFFFMFRQCYTINKGHSDANCWYTMCLSLYPMYRVIKLCRSLSNNIKNTSTTNRNSMIDIFRTKTGYNKDSEDYFDTKAFCIALSWGLVVAIPLVCIIAVFHLLSVILVSEFLGAIQTFIIILSLLIIYKILGLNEPDVPRFLRKLRNTLNNKSEQKETKGICGRLTLLHYYYNYFINSRLSFQASSRPVCLAIGHH